MRQGTLTRCFGICFPIWRMGAICIPSYCYGSARLPNQAVAELGARLAAQHPQVMAETPLSSVTLSTWENWVKATSGAHKRLLQGACLLPTHPQGDSDPLN